VLGASFDKVEDNKAFCDKFDLPYKLLTFPRVPGDAWDVDDPDDPGYARRISYLIGPDRRIVKAYETVVPAKHPAEVLADVP